MRSGPDADRWNRQQFGDFARNLEIDNFQHDRIGAGGFDRARVVDQSIAMRTTFESRSEAGRLRRYPDVSDDRNSRPRNRAHTIGFVDAALQFDRTGPAFFDA